MSSLAPIAFALWTLFMCSLPLILNFIRLRRFSSTLPGPSVGELIKNSKNGKILSWLCELTKKYNSPFCIWLGKDLFVFFSDPQDVREILSSNKLLEKSSSYNFLRPWLGNGLLTNGGLSWHSRRKLLTPAFHFKILSEFKEPMEDNCNILVSKLKEKADGAPFDIYPYITLFALDVICETAMGIKKHAQLQSHSEYVQAVQSICRILHHQSFSLWYRALRFLHLDFNSKEISGVLKVLHGETERLIKSRRKVLQDSGINSLAEVEKSNEFDKKKRFAFLDMLLISQMEGVDLPDTQIREEVDTFMFEGHDTTSSAISFAIYLLSQHADVQQKAYEEALSFEGHEKEAMPYLEAVIKETLRIYPTVPFFSRKITEDFQVGKITVPKGANISTLVYMTHRDDNNYPNPGKFDPERFFSKELQPFSFAAFSAGPRNCIGQKFAFLELKCSLSALLRNFEFLPVENFKPSVTAELVLKSGNGIQIRLKTRNI